MNTFLRLLRLLPWTLAVLSQLLVVVAMKGEMSARGLRLPQVAWSAAAYAAGALLGVLALVGAVRHWPAALPLAIASALAMLAGPLLWGRAIDEFHLPHHAVRLVVLVICLVLFWWYVASHR